MIIAIDGFSSCGKSTLAKELADHLDLVYVDSGAMYRAVTCYLIENNISVEDEDTIAAHLNKINIVLKRVNGSNRTFLNGKDVEHEIRGKEVSSLVSPVAAIGIIRDHLVACQRNMAIEGYGIVMDGRDIGTVVFPNADIKFFITAAMNVRVERRLAELQAKGINMTYEEVKENLATRDHIDSHRAHSPLRQAENAIVIDNTFMTREEQLSKVLSIINENKRK